VVVQSILRKIRKGIAPRKKISGFFVVHSRGRAIHVRVTDMTAVTGGQSRQRIKLII
jgi:hypothetical protein